jgi:hypothetical protein
MNASFLVLNFCNPQLYDIKNLELGDKESPRLSTYIRVLGSSLLTLTSTQHTPPKTNHDAHLCSLLRWCLQVNRRRVVAPNLVILEKRNQSTILLLADALSFKLAVFFYTATMQTEKLRLNDMTTNLPAKTAMAKVVPAAAAVEMVVVRSSRRVGWGCSRNHCGAMKPPIHSQINNNCPSLSPPLTQRISWQQCQTIRGQ